MSFQSRSPMATRNSAWSINLFAVRGVPVRVHASFLLLFVWVFADESSSRPLNELLFVLGLFTCVLLHEIGHALVASNVGQIVSLVLGAFALLIGHMVLLVIAAIVFVNAVQTYFRERARAALAGHRIDEMMVDAAKVVTFSHGMLVSQALTAAL